MEKLKCLRCGHEWYQRTPALPKYCPVCKQSKWTTPARVRVLKIKREPAERSGAPPKYPIQDLEIGQSIKIPWPQHINDQPDHKKIRSINSSIISYARRSGKSFTRSPQPLWLLVTRTK